jgi:uncharacterized protein (DUF427 family)
MQSPDHRITLETAPRRWRAEFAGHVIADSDQAVVLSETGFPPRIYFPREDVAMEYMSRTDAATHCPYKGDAAYYTLLMDGQFAENGVWTYEQPLEGMERIAGMLSFYPDRVNVYEVEDAAVNPHHSEGSTPAAGQTGPSGGGDVDAVVQHTDSGAGAPQRDHWPTNVSGPDGDDAGLR